MGMLDGWKYCPRCATEVRRDGNSARCPTCGFAAWGASVPGAEAICLDERGRVLLGRRAFAPAAGLWDLPGGFLDEGEGPLDALRREVEEETGCEIEPLRFLGVWNEPYDGRIVLCLTWVARLHGDPRPADDLAELRWFAPAYIPWTELAFTHYEPALRLALRQEDAHGERFDPQLDG